MADFVREMDPETLFVHLFCNKLAESIKNFRQMASYYVSDHRPGTLVENFDSDAKKYAEYVKMFGTSRR